MCGIKGALIAHFLRIVPACVELMERYIRVGAHFWPDYTGLGTYHYQERRRIREELQGVSMERNSSIYSLSSFLSSSLKVCMAVWASFTTEGKITSHLEPVGGRFGLACQCTWRKSSES
ncbi:hypothetical protein XENTR_v10004016 [Xenopus tropicalis]|nr:hypothetical protein XENTR_v10003977 [Xenopus tropicalis]KAE8576010.1 hypothetical protein XENTR_v10004016 [Xenopus tropicalis]